MIFPIRSSRIKCYRVVCRVAVPQNIFHHLKTKHPEERGRNYIFQTVNTQQPTRSSQRHSGYSIIVNFSQLSPSLLNIILSGFTLDVKLRLASVLALNWLNRQVTYHYHSVWLTLLFWTLPMTVHGPVPRSQESCFQRMER